ncbi:MAG: DUF4097 family beta strand repeat-containing protein [Calditrichaeota bacterium]|nr:DUF4097 family beta strand repeat-containing protein [Calditrichota bacterium]
MRTLKQGNRRAARLLFIFMAIAAAAAPLIAGDDRVHGKFVRTLEVNGKIALSVKNSNGKTTVRVGTDDKVHIYSTISAGTKWDCDRKSSERKVRKFEKNHAFEMEGNHIRLGAWDDHEMAHCTLIDYEIQVPAGTALEIENKYGNIRIRDVGGPVDLELQAGGARVTGASAKVQAQIGIGTLIVEGSPGEDWFLDVGTGSVEVRLPKDAGFNLEAETEDGTIDCDFSIKYREKNGKDLLRGSVNGGGPLIHIKTEMGGIRIWER